MARGSWHDANDPLVRDLVGRASVDGQAAMFAADAADPSKLSLVDPIVSDPVEASTGSRFIASPSSYDEDDGGDDEVDPLVVDPVQAMCDEHIRIGHINRVRRGRR